MICSTLLNVPSVSRSSVSMLDFNKLAFVQFSDGFSHRCLLSALCPFGGPIIGPIVGSFIGVSTSWRWIFYVLIIFSFVMFVLGFLNPETYAPVLLRRKANKLQKETGKVFRSQFDLHPMFAAPLATKMKTAIARPFVLLFKEMIVLLMSLYAAFI